MKNLKLSNLLFFQLVVFVLNASTPPQLKANYPIEEIPDSLSKEAKAVVRESIGEFKVFTPAKANYHIKLAVTVFKENHPYSYIPIDYDKFSKIKNIKVRYYDTSGKLLRKLETNEVRDVAVNDGSSFQLDTRRKVIENEYGTYPYTFELEYEIEYSSLRGYEDWHFQTYEVGVQKSTYTITFPSSLNPNVRIHNAHTVREESTVGDFKSYTWSLSNLVPVKSESYSPPTAKILPYIEVSPDIFEYDGIKGKMTNWNAFGQFLYDLNKNRDQVSDEMKVIIKRLTENAKTNFDKIEALYHYIQQNIRYVSIQQGIGGWQTFDAYYVEKNKFGDCKALSNFMKAMLREVGIESNLVVIRAGDDNYTEIDTEFCNPVFNHMILYIPSEKIWLECTSRSNPTGYLGSMTSGRKALMITSVGGKLIDTPPLSIDQNNQIATTVIKLSENSSATVTNTSNFKGILHEPLRMLKGEYSKEDFQKGFQKASKIPNFTINHLENIVFEQKPEATLQYELSVEKYASKSGNRLFVPINLHNPFDHVPPKVDKRIHDIEAFEHGYSEVDTIKISMPEGFDIESIPQKSVDLKSDLGSFSLNVEVSGSDIKIVRILECNPVHLPASKYNDFRDFCKKIQQSDAMKIVLKKKT